MIVLLLRIVSAVFNAVLFVVITKEQLGNEQLGTRRLIVVHALSFLLPETRVRVLS